MNAYTPLTKEQAAWLKTVAVHLYHRQGYYLTPVRNALTDEGRKDPRPLCAYTGWRDDVQTEDMVERWFSVFPVRFNALLARARDMLVVDTDSDDSTRRFAELVTLRRVPATMWVVTSGRGSHFYYRNPDGLHSRSGSKIDILTTASRSGEETNGKGIMVAGSWHPVTRRVYELVDLGGDFEPSTFSGEHMEALESAGLIAPEKPPRPTAHLRANDCDPERYRGMLSLPPPQDEPTFFRIATSLLTVFAPDQVVAWASIGAKYRPAEDRRKIEGWAMNAAKGPIGVGTAIHYYQSAGVYSQRIADAECRMSRIWS